MERRNPCILQGRKRMAEEAFHATPSDVEISEAVVALKKLAEQPEETSEAGGAG